MRAAANDTPPPQGMWQSALWLMDHHLGRVIDALKAHPGYDLAIVGHSMGAGGGGGSGLHMCARKSACEPAGACLRMRRMRRGIGVSSAGKQGNRCWLTGGRVAVCAMQARRGKPAARSKILAPTSVWTPG
jgi:pimeloyl-ACP methyl ester carboxylesterase